MKKVAISLGIMCLILTMAIFIQIRTVKNITEEEGIILNDNTELKSEVLRWRQINKDAYSQLDEAEKRLEEIRTEVSQNNGLGVEVAEEIKKNYRLLGQTEIKGPGVIIRLDDNREVNSEDILDPSIYMVHEEDLIQIVNELFNAEADAVSINGKRVVSTTSILCDGNIIRVNDEMVGVPIEIKAIGYPERIAPALARPGGYLSIMKTDGVIVEIEKSEKVTIPKYEGIYNYEYIIH